jgi:adenosylcobinamide kinase/adenosylcobinamide-phosphate guanylyltransferase
VLVSNEVGMGVVPPFPLGRVYRDLLGQVNAWLAAEADRVFLMVAGLPLPIKPLARDEG